MSCYRLIFYRFRHTLIKSVVLDVWKISQISWLMLSLQMYYATY